MRISDWSSDVCSSDLPNIWPNEAPNLWRKRCSGERWLRSAKRVWMERAMALNSRICRMLGIEHPIVLAGMGGASVPALAAAVSTEGGLGVLGAAACSPERLRSWYRETRATTDTPSGVEIFLSASEIGRT